MAYNVMRVVLVVNRLINKVKNKQMVKDLNYWKNNCEEDYLHTPISVLRYITELEKKVEETINPTRCCNKFSKDRLEQAIVNAKPNLDKIKDVDRNLDSIR